MFARLAHRIANISFVKRFLTENRFFVRHYFNWRYKREDPYMVTTSEEEKEKYDRLIKAIGGKETYENILELGCGEGRLSRRIADKTGRLLAVDISDFAIGRAKEYLADHENVTIRRFDIFTDDPEDTFELVVCSEVLFYFEPDQLPGVIERIIGWIKPGGYAALVHTRVISDDGAGVDLKKFGAKTIHGMFMNDPRISLISDDIQPMYRITMVRKEK